MFLFLTESQNETRQDKPKDMVQLFFAVRFSIQEPSVDFHEVSDFKTPNGTRNT